METERFDDWGGDSALRDGLRRLSAPAPVPSDFDTHILEALRRPQPWWRTLLREARPLLAGAVCSGAFMLAALTWSLQTPSSLHHGPPSPLTHTARPLDMTALDHLLDRPGLSAASFAGIMTPHGPVSPPETLRLAPPAKRRVSQILSTLV